MDIRTTEEGLSTINWYTTDNPYAQQGYYGQCTWYAWGRVSEISGHAIPYSRGHAISYASKDFLERVDSPTFGAICVWGGNYYGHVAVVEQVNEDGTILISEGNYSGMTFHTATLSPSNGYSYNGMPFMGFYLYDGVTKAIEEERAKLKAEQEAKEREVQKMLEHEKVDMGYSFAPTTNFLGTPDSMMLMGTLSIQFTKKLIKNRKVFDIAQKLWYIMSVLSWEHKFA